MKFFCFLKKFDCGEYFRQTGVQFVLYVLMTMENRDACSRKELLMIGAIAGDIIGSVYEWDKISARILNCFPQKVSSRTIPFPDCSTGGHHFDWHKLCRYLSFDQGILDKGYGGSFMLARSSNPMPYNSWEMELPCASVPLDTPYNDIDTVLQKAAEFTEITHNHPEGIKGGQAKAAAINLARMGKSKSEIKRFHRDKLSIRFEPTRGRDPPIV